MSQDNNVVQESNVDQNEDLKSFLDKEVSCVDKGETGLTLDLNSSESMWTPVHVLKPSNGTDLEKTDSVLSAEELSDLDGIEFLSHASNDAPGVVLMKCSLRVWTPVAASLVNQTLFRSAGCIIDHQHAEKGSGHSGHCSVAIWNVVIVKSRDMRPHYYIILSSWFCDSSAYFRAYPREKEIEV